MIRVVAILLVAVLACPLADSVASAQTQTPPAAAVQEPAAKPRFLPPVRGVATIGILKPATKVEGNEVVTTLRIKNLSTGSIALLRVDETWYDKAGNTLPGDSQRWRKPFAPGEVIEIQLRTPKNPKFFQNTFQFSHANGKCEVKTLPKFE